MVSPIHSTRRKLTFDFVIMLCLFKHSHEEKQSFISNLQTILHLWYFFHGVLEVSQHCESGNTTINSSPYQPILYLHRVGQKHTHAAFSVLSSLGGIVNLMQISDSIGTLPPYCLGSHRTNGQIRVKPNALPVMPGPNMSILFDKYII